jgi:subtilisin family serine protease
VDPTHPDLASRYGGFWYDPYGQHATPFDPNNHGTHTTGTAVGGDASGKNIGVAPGATWIAAKAWNDAGVGFTSAFHQIFQWFLAPGGNPANAPDVVNNSWAFTSTGCITEFLPDVQAWRVAEIFPAFAAGNSGPSGGTALSPGNYAESFAMGATDSSDNIASFSSRGPSPCDGLVRPDVSAPGVSVRSSVPGGYVSYNGTSMATPHVTGAVAVLRSINPNLTVDELESALTQGAVDLGTLGPDNNFGAGRLDLFQSAQLVIGAGPGQPDLVITSLLNPPATVVAGGSFTVTDTTKNSGTATAGGSTTRYRLSTDATITGSDVLLTGSRSVPSLATGVSSGGSIAVTVPSTVAPGTYYLGACADDPGAVTESNETNNCRASTTTIKVRK